MAALLLLTGCGAADAIPEWNRTPERAGSEDAFPPFPVSKTGSSQKCCCVILPITGLSPSQTVHNQGFFTFSTEFSTPLCQLRNLRKNHAHFPGFLPPPVFDVILSHRENFDFFPAISLFCCRRNSYQGQTLLCCHQKATRNGIHPD